jgi:hypothetical protein
MVVFVMQPVPSGFVRPTVHKRPGSFADASMPQCRRFASVF